MIVLIPSTLGLQHCRWPSLFNNVPRRIQTQPASRMDRQTAINDASDAAVNQNQHQRCIQSWSLVHQPPRLFRVRHHPYVGVRVFGGQRCNVSIVFARYCWGNHLNVLSGCYFKKWGGCMEFGMSLLHPPHSSPTTFTVPIKRPPPISLLNNTNHAQNNTGNTNDLVLPIAPAHDPVILGANNIDDIVDEPVNICELFLINYIFFAHSKLFRWKIYTRQHAMI